MKLISGEWVDANSFIPENNNWKIVRCEHAHLNEECVYYFMAYFWKEKGWQYFDDDKGYQESMKVTHWMNEPYISVKEEII